VRGTVEQVGDELRITAELVDTATGRQIWAQRYAADGTDLFAVRDDVAQSIAAQLGEKVGPLTAATLLQSKRKETDALAAYELVLLAADPRLRFNEADNARALQLLERAVALDPHYARAHADLAWTHWQSIINSFSDDPAASFAAPIASAEAAIRADPHYAEGYWARATVTTCEDDDPADGAVLYRKALELNPHHPGLMVEWGGYILAQTLDRAEEGVALVERARRLNRRHPDWYDGA
jgi:Tfp pilus assembly protein PilF